MKKNIICLFTLLILTSQMFALAGFGLNLNQSLYNVDKSSSALEVGGLEVGQITQESFSNGYGVGGYLYVDAIPFIDLDIEGSITGSLYDFKFTNQLANPIEEQFAWASTSIYITAKKKLFQLKIPFLAKAKLTGGIGFNSHNSTPMINQDMLEAVMGGANNLESGALDTDKLVDYLADNKIASSGIHLQGGLQFKVLMFDSFLFYRQIIADDLIPGKKGLGSINLRLGMGF